MRMIEEIRRKVESGAFEFSRHAVDQTLKRRISLSEIRQAIANAEVIEEYPNDKYGPSCLLIGFTAHNRPLHVQCSYPSRPILKIITVYEPNPALWDEFRVRKS
jgi:hypothetical protein